MAEEDDQKMLEKIWQDKDSQTRIKNITDINNGQIRTTWKWGLYAMIGPLGTITALGGISYAIVGSLLNAFNALLFLAMIGVAFLCLVLSYVHLRFTKSKTGIPNLPF